MGHNVSSLRGRNAARLTRLANSASVCGAAEMLPIQCCPTRVASCVAESDSEWHRRAGTIVSHGWRAVSYRMVSSRTLDKTQHLYGRLGRQWVMGEARAWRDVSGHVSHALQLGSICLRKQRDHHVFQGNHANAKLHQLGVGQRWMIGRHVIHDEVALDALLRSTTLVLPSRQGLETYLKWAQNVGVVMHEKRRGLNLRGERFDVGHAEQFRRRFCAGVG
jgi:hypothetical protein